MKTIRFAVAALLILTFCSVGWGYTDNIHRWTEDALLHDGRTVLVEREIQETMEIRIADPFFGLPIAPRTERGGEVQFLKFKHPDTGTTVTWQGKQYHRPVLLGVVDGIVYLVIFALPSKKYEQELGCPELPYVFLQSGLSNWSRWSPIPAEKAPVVLRVANLGPGYAWSSRELKPSELAHRTAEQVQVGLLGEEKQSGNRFQRDIPRAYEEWRFSDKEKDEYRNSRFGDDCRPPPKPRSDIVLPSPVDVELESVETADVTAKTSDEYYKTLWSKKGTATREDCKALFTRADPADRMAGERFVNDSTRTKRPPYSGRSVSGFMNTPTKRYCDAKFVWYVAEGEERGRIWITKYTAAGDLVYHVRIRRPQTADNKLAGDFVIDSTTVEGGYFYFYWDQSLPSPSPLGPFPHRMTKFRFHEPSAGAATK